MSSPTQRSLQHCRKNGWIAGVVEKWNQWAKVRQDLFGCIDIIVIDDLEQGPLAVQATSGSGHAARRKKSIAEPRLKLWLESPARFEIWSWSQRGPKGKRKLCDSVDPTLFYNGCSVGLINRTALMGCSES